MQIAVIDDHSTLDEPLEVVRRLGGDRVEFVRHPQNLGVVGNLNRCLQLARGRLVHVLHGDDWVRDGFYERLEIPFEAHPEIGAAFCRHQYVDPQGNAVGEGPDGRSASGVLTDATWYLGCEQRIMTPCMVVRREVYERLGGFDRRLQCAEDWEMWMRIAANDPIYYAHDVLACYRMHDNSNTGRNVRSGRDLSHTGLAIRLFSEYLPADESRAVRRQAGRTYSRAAIDMARRLHRQRDIQGMRAQLSAAWQLSRSWDTAVGIARVLARAACERLVPSGRKL